MSTTRRTKQLAATAVAAALGVTALAGCGSSGKSDSGSGGTKSSGSKTVTLVSHDSFNASKDVLKEFTEETGYTVKVLKSGDAGVALNQEILTKGSPRGDVFFGVDNTLLSRALDSGLFTPYEAKGIDQVAASTPNWTPSTGSPRSTPATSASTTTRSTSPTRSSRRRSPSTTWRSPSTRTSSSPRTPRPPRPASASSSAPSPPTARRATRTTGRS